MTRTIFALALFTALSSCTTGSTGGTPDDPAREVAPWKANPQLSAASVPEVYLQQWSKAENRKDCRLLAFADLGDGMSAATPRAANFGGGWAVSYDLEGRRGITSGGRLCKDCGRGVFGIAGTGTSPEGSYEGWPHWMYWRDGSRAGYGPEGGTGPRDLAYLIVRGEGCLYNVWSLEGTEHLEHLLRNLRFVDVD